MKVINGDFWVAASDYQGLVCTTNGVVKQNGELVMGAGIAKDFSLRYPYLPAVLGRAVSRYGNNVYVYSDISGQYLISLPTKHNWKEPSSIGLIQQSINQLVLITTALMLDSVLMTPPGCGMGGLDFSDVEGIISKLDDRFTVCFK